MPKDGFQVVAYLTSLLENNKYDLIITGRESIDYNGGMVGGMLATKLKIPYVKLYLFRHKDDNLNLEREFDGGKEKLTVHYQLL